MVYIYIYTYIHRLIINELVLTKNAGLDSTRHETTTITVNKDNNNMCNGYYYNKWLSNKMVA